MCLCNANPRIWVWCDNLSGKPTKCAATICKRMEWTRYQENRITCSIPLKKGYIYRLICMR